MRIPSAESPPIDVEFPDLSAYAASNTGLPYVWRFAWTANSGDRSAS